MCNVTNDKCMSFKGFVEGGEREFEFTILKETIQYKTILVISNHWNVLR